MLILIFIFFFFFRQSYRPLMIFLSLVCLVTDSLSFLYFQIREDWKYVAMVIDRLQLYIFFAVTTAGTIGILLDAPHIFQYVDQDKIIEIHKGKPTWVENTCLYFTPKRKKNQPGHSVVHQISVLCIGWAKTERKAFFFIQWTPSLESVCEPIAIPIRHTGIQGQLLLI